LKDSEDKQAKIKEYVISGNVLSALICFAALLAFFQPMNLFRLSSAFVVLTLTLFGLLLIIIKYITSKEKIATGIAESPSWASYLFYCIIMFLISIIIFLGHEDNGQVQLLFFIPVANAAISHGKKFSLFIALIASVLITLNSLDIFGIKKLDYSADIYVLHIVTLFFTAWLVGGLASIEKDIRTKLMHLANYDELTGLMNHRSFHDQLDYALAKAKENKQELSLIMADIDYFKHYNDTHGHQRGDEALATLGKIFRELVCEPNIPARYGGEEFAFIITSLSFEETVDLAEKIRKAVEETFFYGGKEQPGGKLTLSIGIANYPRNAENKEGLIRAADQALYKAKFMNKNKVEVYFSVLDELKDKINHSEQELFNSVRTLISIINAKDRYTFGHSERVTAYAVALARRLMLSEEEISTLKYGAFLHDVGKIEIDRYVLNKEANFSEKEWELIKQHPVWGAEILKPLFSLRAVIPVVLYHHENFDGTGYPSGLKGEEIPLLARIIRIVDSFDAMTTDRSYKKAVDPSCALNELIRFSGKYYDSRLVAEFVEFIREEILNQKTLSLDNKLIKCLLAE